MLFKNLREVFNDPSIAKERNLRWTVGGLTLWGISSLLWLAIYTLGFLDIGRWYVHGLTKSVAVFGYSALLGLAFVALGGLFGFLFGIPRTIQAGNSSSTGNSIGSNPTQSTGMGYQQAVNTNLEQISDWLTKILVGVGLTQLGNIPHAIWNLAYNLKSELNNSQAAATFVILNGLVCGFFAGYLMTRLFLAGAFSEADRATATAFVIQASQLAGKYTQEGQYGSAVVTLEKALLKVDTDTPKTEKRRLYEQLTYNYLYQPAPEGFGKVIELGRKYLKEEPSMPSPVILANLALAFGQSYKWELVHQNSEEVLAEYKRKALDAIQQAIALEPKMLNLFQTVWNPKDASKAPGEEDDLEVFFGDPGFGKILDQEH